MKQGWEIKKLGEVCKVIAGQSPEGKFYNSEGNGMPFYQGKKEYGEKYIGEPTTWTTKITKEAEAGDILMSVRAPVGPVNFSTQKICIGRGLAAIRAGKNIDKEFLYNFLIKHENEIEGNAGAVFNSINKTQIEAIEIPLPPLPEQQRIVSILDETFAAIAKAKANAEQNLQNAKELFESYLQSVFEKKGDDWEEKTLGEVCEIDPKKSEIKGLENNNIVSFLPMKDLGVLQNTIIPIQTRKLSEVIGSYTYFRNNDILLAKVTPCFENGKLGIAKNLKNGIGFGSSEYIVFRPLNIVISDYIFYILSSTKFREEGRQLMFGACGLKRLSKDYVRTFLVQIPSLNEQQSIVHQLDALRAETQKLEAVYHKKLEDLEELKKSILQKAFAGELTSSVTLNVPSSKTIPLQKVEGISSTDLQAGITAIALQKHLEQNKQNAFGHVKAEKIVHLAEYVLNVDLERNPMKDAAGPNDFPHAKKVESRAAKAGFYTVAKKAADQETGYIFTQGSSMNSLIQKTQNCLGERNELLSQLLKLLVPMKTQQAEIVATVYAAWNNLILHGNQFTDNDIVTEARENWRVEKLQISREKFFNAIEWMRQYEFLIPIGNGKPVKTKSL